MDFANDSVLELLFVFHETNYDVASAAAVLEGCSSIVGWHRKRRRSVIRGKGSSERQRGAEKLELERTKYNEGGGCLLLMKGRKEGCQY